MGCAEQAMRRAGPRGADGPRAVREREGSSGPELAGRRGRKEERGGREVGCWAASSGPRPGRGERERAGSGVGLKRRKGNIFQIQLIFLL